MSKLAKALTAAAGNAGASLYVEDVFSTYLYTGTGAAQDIVNGIDLETEGGLVWIKDRDSGTRAHYLFDSEHLAAPYYNQYLSSNDTDALYTATGTGNGLGGLFNTDGFPVQGNHSSSGVDYTSWTFRKAEKFFDVVTYSGNNTLGRTVAHNLGSVPACIIVKCTSRNTTAWTIYHSSLGATKYLEFDTGAAGTAVGYWNNTEPTDSVFTLGNDGNVNATGRDYVAYLFASDAGGFGDDGSESIIKCGSVTTGNVSTDVDVNLGFEPQWILMKNSGAASQWFLVDTMRGWVSPTGVTNQAKPLFANLTNAESSGTNFVKPTATGFTVVSDNLGDAQDWIYIAIRRPMKTPESGTEVFAIGQGDGDADIPDYISNFPVDAAITKRTSAGNNGRMSSRLTGANYLSPNLTQAESADGAATFDFMNGWGSDGVNRNTDEYAWMFKRATGFFDVVAYTGDGVAGRTVAHNLGAAPELMIVKKRNSTGDWPVYHSGFNAGVNPEQYKARLNSIVTQSADSSVWNNTAPNQDNFTLGASSNVNASSSTYIAYLFGTIAGVSKVGRYTGNGTSQTINCGFSSGARFVLIKAANDFSDWNVFDTSRGIVAGNDPYLKLNSTDAEVTTVDAIDPNSTGFDVVNGGGGYNMPNVNGVEYIFLAIA